jgi:hypothetical protein
VESNAAAGDLNQVIASAVQARIETEVATALSGSELMTQYVSAALHQKIQVEDRGSYRKRETTWLRETIDKAIREATKVAVAKVMQEEAEAIEKHVAAELRKNVKGIASTLVGKIADVADSPYGVTVELRYPGRD